MTNTMKKSPRSLNAQHRINAYLFKNTQRNGLFSATAVEIAKYARVNYNTVRRLLGQMMLDGEVYREGTQYCRVSKRELMGYSLSLNTMTNAKTA